MALSITKVAFGCAHVGELTDWLAANAAPDSEWPGEARITTRYIPTRVKEMDGGSLYWIHGGMLIGRTPILGFAQKPDGKWWIRLAPRLIAVEPRPRRAHQGWRYLAAEDAPVDLAGSAGEPMPGPLASELAKLGLL